MSCFTHRIDRKKQSQSQAESSRPLRETFGYLIPPVRFPKTNHDTDMRPKTETGKRAEVWHSISRKKEHVDRAASLQPHQSRQFARWHICQIISDRLVELHSIRSMSQPLQPAQTAQPCAFSCVRSLTAARTLLGVELWHHLQ